MTFDFKHARDLIERFNEARANALTVAGALPAALDEIERLNEEIEHLRDERDAYRSMVCDLLASAHPHPTDHPTMSKQWDRARDLLKHGPATRRREAGGE